MTRISQLQANSNRPLLTNSRLAQLCLLLRSILEATAMVRSLYLSNSKGSLLTSGSLICVLLASLAACTNQTVQPKPTADPATQLELTMNTEKAILAGGCFWGMEDLFRKQAGVISTRVGYSGGDVKNATYRNHGTHAEAIEVVFDPAKTDFRKLLEFFFQIHDPTTKNRQGNDRGASYRSAIYYTDEQQKQVALDTIEDVNASGLWPGKVVTEVEPAGDFWEAEPEHQDYLVHNPGGYTCHFPRKDWVLPKRSAAK